MKTTSKARPLTAALALLLAAALTLAGCQGTATAPDPVSPPPAEESSSAAPESSSQPAAPAEPEPETSAPEPPAESSSQPEETPPQSGASDPAAPAPESASTPPPSSESQGAAGETERYVNGLDMTDPDNHPEIPKPVWRSPKEEQNNPRPRISLDGIYDRPDRKYFEGCVAPDDENNPYHFDFREYDFFMGIPEGGWVDERGYVIHPNGSIYWSSASNLPIPFPIS